MSFGSVEDVERALSEESYLPDRGLATALFLALAMPRLRSFHGHLSPTERGSRVSHSILVST